MCTTYLHVFEGILLRDASQDILFTALLQFTGQQQLVKYVVGFREGEDDIELAHVAVVFVHLFDVSVDDLQGYQLVVVGVGSCDEEERSISAVDDLRVCMVGLLEMSRPRKGL